MMMLAIAVQLAAVDAMPQPVAASVARTEAGGVMLPKDTPVELMAPAEVSTADAAPGTVFKLRVNRAIELGGTVAVPVGTPAFGQVVTAVDSGGLGKSGRMTAKLLSIRLGSVEIPLDGETSAKGTGAGSAGVAVLFTGFVGLFHRGNNAKIKAGELLVGYVARDTLLPAAAALPATNSAHATSTRR